MIKIRKVLVLVDFSKNSERAVHYGVEIGRTRKARVFFIHVVNRRIVDTVWELSSKGYKGEFVQTLRKMIQDRESDLKQFVSEEWREGLDVEFLIRRGEPDDEVITVAKEFSIDLIIVGSQGHTSLAADVIGSVAQKVVNRAPCPVLVVRPIEHDFIG